MTSQGKIISFNEEQIEGLNKIRHWLKNGETFFTLAGYAGTGKSSIVKKILDEYRGDVVVSSPTHKATGVISDLTDREGKTLQSLLGLRPDCEVSDFNPDKPDFHPIADPKLNSYDFVILDECSMVNSTLFSLIKELTLNTQTKILFVGDPAQIPPIGQKISEVFYQSDIEIHWLTKVERQKSDSPLLPLCDNLRNNLDSVDGGFSRKTNVNDKGEGVIFITDKDEFRKIILETFNSESSKNDINFAKVIAWRNKTVMSSNKIIRTALFGKDSDVIENGDAIMGYRSVRSSNGRYNVIANSMDYKVVGKMDLSINKYGISGYQVRLREDLPHSKFKNKDIFIIDSDNEDNLYNYAELHDKFKKIGKERKKLGSWEEYYSFRRQNILMKTITKYRDGTPRNKHEEISKDVFYSFAITGHRAQGSTYNKVFVIESDIKCNPVVKERNQIFYVSVSRPIVSATILCEKIND
jgi:exodeoxyribonuclease-5